MSFLLATKCAPDKKILKNVKDAGIDAVELYTSKEILKDPKKVIEICKEFPLEYAIHAPNDDYCPEKLAELSMGLNASVLVIHNIYWDDEWEKLYEIFKNMKTTICIENVISAIEQNKFVRRFNFGRCLDIEHLQIECAGVMGKEFIPVIQEANHIHLSGYYFGSNLWHSHIHHSPEHSHSLLDLIKSARYSFMIVSEASVKHQTLDEFKKLNDFFKNWADTKY